jgi:hypothetical protein
MEQAKHWQKMMNILLVEPNFPYPNKSKNQANQVHKNFVPIALLKFATLHKEKGNRIKLVRGKVSKGDVGFLPNEILVTSVFTYWSYYVWDCITYYRQLYPHALIRLGGIYATLHSDKEKFRVLAKKFKVLVYKGINQEAEKYLPDYSVLPPVDYHATHMMRGCIRKCNFCGTWKLEPEITHKTKDEIIYELLQVGKNKVIFYDNNILANSHIKEILKALINFKINGKAVVFESQSGFDGRLLEKDQTLADLIRQAGFQNVRIAWDNGLEDKYSLKKQISILTKAGYAAKDISIFMIYNFIIPYENMLKKLGYCRDWGVQITDCRYRPLDIDYDNYNPHFRHGQPAGSYYIHEKSGWTDQKVRDFRSRVRKHNIWVRYAKDKGREYDNKMEKWSAINNTYKFFNLGRPPYMERIERSALLRKKIRLLNKKKNYYILNNISPNGVGSYSVKDLEQFIDKYINQPRDVSPRYRVSANQILRKRV